MRCIRLHSSIIVYLLILTSSNCARERVYVPLETAERIPSVRMAPAAPIHNVVLSNVAPQKKAGVSIVVEPINLGSYSTKAPELLGGTSLQICKPVSGASDLPNIGANPNVVATKLPRVDLTFLITVHNETPHSLDLRSAVIQVEDAQGVSYEPIPGDSCVVSSEVKNERRNPRMIDSMRVLPGKSRTGYSAFCFHNRNLSVPVKLLIYDVPVQTDAAGNVTQRENFTFQINGEISVKYYDVDQRNQLALSDTAPRCYQYTGRWVRDKLSPMVETPVSKASSQPSDLKRIASLDDVLTKQSESGLIRACWNAYAGETDSVPVNLSVDPSGTILKVDISNSVKNGALTNCISRVLKGIQFGSFSGVKPIPYAVHLRPGSVETVPESDDDY